MSGIKKEGNPLATERIGKLIARFAIPAIISMLVSSLYNIVDQIFIGQGVGMLGNAATNIAFPVSIICTATALLLGIGSSSNYNLESGAGNQEEACRIVGTGLTMLVVCGMIIAGIVLMFLDPLLKIFGVTPEVLPYAQDYTGITAWGIPFLILTTGGNHLIRADRSPAYSMTCMLTGAILNTILDPLFIFGFGMGMAGAALATIISQAVSAAWVIRFLISKRSVMKLRLGNMRLRREVVKRIAGLGISPFIMQSTESMVSITLNSGLQNYGGDLYVGTMSIMTSIMQLILIPVQGIAQGVQPIISYNYGAGDQKRVKGTFMRLLVSGLLGTLILGGAAVLAPQIYAGIFTNNKELIALTCQVMPVYFLGITVFGLQSACQSTFLALGQAKVSLFIALLRKVLLLIPLALIFPRFMGVMGIYRAEPTADIISVTTTCILFAITMKRVLRDMEEKVPVVQDEAK